MKVVIVGGGQIGCYLAQLLIQGGHDVKVVEQRESRLPTFQRDLPEGTYVIGNGTDPKFLESIDIEKADVVAAVTGTDETNLVICTMARFEYGVDRTVARVNNPKNEWLFTPMMGVDVKVNQADLIGHLIADEMSIGAMMTLFKTHRGKFSLVEKTVDATSSVVGKKIRDLSLPDDCALVAVVRNSDLLIPHGSFVLEAYDDVVAITNDASKPKLSDLLGVNG